MSLVLNTGYWVEENAMNSNDLELVPEFRSKPFLITVKAMEPFTIPHEMSRVPAGWLVIDRSSAMNVWRSGAMDTSKLELTADQDGDITLVLL